MFMAEEKPRNLFQDVLAESLRQMVLIRELEANNKLLTEALEGIGLDYPDGKKCFCGMAVGNLMCTGHSTQCNAARAALYGEDK
jgi:hypothetical protein